MRSFIGKCELCPLGYYTKDTSVEENDDNPRGDTCLKCEAGKYAATSAKHGYSGGDSQCIVW